MIDDQSNYSSSSALIDRMASLLMPYKGAGGFPYPLTATNAPVSMTYIVVPTCHTAPSCLAPEPLSVQISNLAYAGPRALTCMALMPLVRAGDGFWWLLVRKLARQMFSGLSE